MASTTPGTATLAINVQDTYAQSSSASAKISETAPPSSGGGGGSLDLLMLFGLSALLIVRSTKRRPTSALVH
jgi:hypothetical protein